MTRDPLRLSDDRRYDVPVSVIACEFSTEQLREWMAEEDEDVLELMSIRDVSYLDLRTGHWPQFTRPGELAQAILTIVGSG